MDVPIVAALLALIGVLATLVFNAWRTYRDASWRRVEKALEMIATGDDRQETIGWAMLDHQIGDRSISEKDALMVEALSVELARIEVEENRLRPDIERSDIVRGNEGVDS